MISIKTNIDQFINGALKETKKAVVKAQISANRKTAKKVIGVFTDEVQKDYAIKDSGIKNALKIKRGSDDEGQRTVAAVIQAVGKQGIPLSKFITRQVKAGVSFIVSKAKGRKVIAHAFIAKMKAGNSSHVGVFIRSGKKRLPIGQKFGPDVKMLIGTPKMMELHNKTVQENYDKIYSHELKWQLKNIFRA
jgi:hypothetical protein